MNAPAGATRRLVLREDVVIESLPREAILAAAPAVEDDKFRVPKLLSDEA